MANRNRKPRTSLAPVTARTLWLAALGLAAISRREAEATAASALAGATANGRRLSMLACDARDVARGGVISLREYLRPAAAGAR